MTTQTIEMDSYRPRDGYFGKPYIDRDEYREKPWPHRNVHGGFENTDRSEEHTSELQSLMRISYAVFCLKEKTDLEHIASKSKHRSRKHKHMNIKNKNAHHIQ